MRLNRRQSSIRPKTVFARKVDKHHAAIVFELRQMGYAVLDLSRVGSGCPDLLVSRGFVTALIEIKTPRGHKTALERRNQAQIDFAEEWKGAIIVAYTASDAHYQFSLLLKRNGWVK